MDDFLGMEAPSKDDFLGIEAVPKDDFLGIEEEDSFLGIGGCWVLLPPPEGFL